MPFNTPTELATLARNVESANLLGLAVVQRGAEIHGLSIGIGQDNPGLFCSLDCNVWILNSERITTTNYMNGSRSALTVAQARAGATQINLPN